MALPGEPLSLFPRCRLIILCACSGSQLPSSSSFLADLGVGGLDPASDVGRLPGTHWMVSFSRGLSRSLPFLGEGGLLDLSGDGSSCADAFKGGDFGVGANSSATLQRVGDLPADAFGGGEARAGGDKSTSGDLKGGEGLLVPAGDEGSESSFADDAVEEVGSVSAAPNLGSGCDCIRSRTGGVLVGDGIAGGLPAPADRLRCKLGRDPPSGALLLSGDGVDRGDLGDLIERPDRADRIERVEFVDLTVANDRAEHTDTASSSPSLTVSLPAEAKDSKESAKGLNSAAVGSWEAGGSSLSGHS